MFRIRCCCPAAVIAADIRLRLFCVYGFHLLLFCRLMLLMLPLPCYFVATPVDTFRLLCRHDADKLFALLSCRRRDATRV